jgi:aspartyl-tRNA(Asn)/glutamyl-tRNA(Gln) amidotransferase subunit A
MSVFPQSVSGLQALYQSGKESPSSVADAVIRRIEQLNPKLNALVWFSADAVRRQAKALEQSSGVRGPLWGVPILIKDNICVNGVPATCASKILKGFTPPYDATAITRLKQAGAILLGMANMDEFAFGSSCEHSCYGPTKNPWDLQRVPGGSSGGSAAAVAAGLSVLALGSETGGSVRQPAAFCGVVGLKPTYGRISRYGLIAFASSLDQIGPFARTVPDAAALLETIAGFDPNDSTSAQVPVGAYRAAAAKEVKGLKIGVPKEYFAAGLDAEIKTAIDVAIAWYRSAGATIHELSMPNTEYAVPVYYIVATAEASSNLARFDGVRFGHRAPSTSSGRADGWTVLEMYKKSRGEGFGSEAKRRIILGTYVLSSGYYDAYYGNALKVRTLIKNDFDRAFEKVDCLLTPTTPTASFKIGEKTNDPLTMYLSDIMTISANLAGVPALSVPCGFTKSGLPIGMQLMARPFGEETLFQAAGAYERAHDWNRNEPVL